MDPAPNDPPKQIPPTTRIYHDPRYLTEQVHPFKPLPDNKARSVVVIGELKGVVPCLAMSEDKMENAKCTHPIGFMTSPDTQITGEMMMGLIFDMEAILSNYEEPDPNISNRPQDCQHRGLLDPVTEEECFFPGHYIAKDTMKLPREPEVWDPFVDVLDKGKVAYWIRTKRVTLEEPFLGL